MFSAREVSVNVLVGLGGRELLGLSSSVNSSYKYVLAGNNVQLIRM
jgi:hypothetical protein